MMKVNSYRIPIFLMFIFIQAAFPVFAQEGNLEMEGRISYITGQNFYVKFENTSGIENGDTLYLPRNSVLEPVLVVQHHSSISCLCSKVGNLNLKVSDRIFALVKRKSPVKPVAEVPESVAETDRDINEQVLTSQQNIQRRTAPSNAVNGRLSLSSYSNFSNTIRDDVHRFRYTLSLDAANVSDSKVSLETYLSFTHRSNQWDLVQENLNNALKIYSLAVRYDFNESASIWAGRKINPKIANVGAVDGVQFQKMWDQFFVGAVVGTRPDFADYGFNADLLEYGAYIGQYAKVDNGVVQSSLAFFEQRNSGNIDRRFLYLQHNNSYVKNLNIFSSFEVDLFEIEDGEEKSTFNLISLYLSLRYRFSRKFSVFGSYDNRKNVIYYETFRNYYDEIIEQASRQGFRLRMNYRPITYLNLGLNAGTRFRETDPNPSNNFRGYATYSRVPYIDASFTLSANVIKTSYVEGQVYGARLTKDIIPGKINAMLNYRMVNFDYSYSDSQLLQNIAEIDVSYYFNKKLYLSVNYEATFNEDENYSRLYLNLRKKF